MISGSVVERGCAMSAPFVGGMGKGGENSHIRVALMHRVLMVKERHTLVEGQDVEQWSIGGIALVVVCGQRGRIIGV